jgi:uncharacterized protein (UPF0332 family)
MSEIEAFMEKAANNIQAAKNLLQDGYLDIAASRIYYAMFYIAEALLWKNELSFSRHSAVIAAFGKNFAHTGLLDAKFHQYLILAEILRHQGDYDVTRAMDREKVEQALIWAEEFLQAGEDFLRRK